MPYFMVVSRLLSWCVDNACAPATGHAWGLAYGFMCIEEKSFCPGSNLAMILPSDERVRSLKPLIRLTQARCLCDS